MDITIESPLELIEECNRTSSEIASTRIEELTSRVYPPTKDLEAFFRSIPGKRVLDVGCGWGYYAKMFAEAGLNYFGVDLSGGMIDAARKTNPLLNFAQMSFRKLEFPEANFDGLWCCCSLYYEPKRNIQNVFQEMHRVLAPGGLLYIVERLADCSGEDVCVSSMSNSPIYWSSWEFEEFKDALASSPFTLVDSFEQYQHGAMSFIVRK